MKGIIELQPKSIRPPKGAAGKHQMSFKLKEGDWYVVENTNKSALEEMMKLMTKGSEIEFDEKHRVTSKINILKQVPEEKEKPKKGSSSGSDSWADEMVRFEDLLSDAHEINKTRFSIHTEVLRDGDGNPMIDLKAKTAIFKATVTVGKDKVFEAHGDATDENVKTVLIKPHFIRMAETRAIARALRWATNNAKCSEEETENGKPDPSTDPEPTDKNMYDKEGVMK